MSTVIIEARHLRKQFKECLAVADVSFTVTKGEILGLLGPNGAGKTTVIQILLGLITRTSGDVSVFGLDPTTHRVQILERCNFCSAYINLPRNLKVRENLQIFAEIYGVKDYRKKADYLLELFEVAHLRDKVTGKLSSGESTRINLCKALLNQPELLLLDEPTASLDPDIADKVRKLLKRIQKEQDITMLYTSHNMRDVHEICSRVLFVNQGSIIADGTPDAIMDQFKQSSLEDVFISIARGGAAAILEGKNELPGN